MNRRTIVFGVVGASLAVGSAEVAQRVAPLRQTADLWKVPTWAYGLAGAASWVAAAQFIRSNIVAVLFALVLNGIAGYVLREVWS